jgi:hypothetical protein
MALRDLQASGGARNKAQQSSIYGKVTPNGQDMAVPGPWMPSIPYPNNDCAFA